MAVFLHFGKEISDMMVKHISIEVTSKQTKKPVFGGPADPTAYILEPVDSILDKKRPAVLLCPGGGYRTLSTREDQPIAMKYLAAGFHVFVLHYSLAPDVFPRALMELALAMKVIRSMGMSGMWMWTGSLFRAFLQAGIWHAVWACSGMGNGCMGLWG